MVPVKQLFNGANETIMGDSHQKMPNHEKYMLTTSQK